MNSRQTDIFKYFNEKNSKYQCKFCNWSTSKNATRMSDHIIKKFGSVQKKFDKFILTIKTNKKVSAIYNKIDFT